MNPAFDRGRHQIDAAARFRYEPRPNKRPHSQPQPHPHPLPPPRPHLHPNPPPLPPHDRSQFIRFSNPIPVPDHHNYQNRPYPNLAPLPEFNYALRPYTYETPTIRRPSPAFPPSDRTSFPHGPREIPESGKFDFGRQASFSVAAPKTVNEYFTPKFEIASSSSLACKPQPWSQNFDRKANVSHSHPSMLQPTPQVPHQKWDANGSYNGSIRRDGYLVPNRREGKVQFGCNGSHYASQPPYQCTPCRSELPSRISVWERLEELHEKVPLPSKVCAGSPLFVQQCNTKAVDISCGANFSAAEPLVQQNTAIVESGDVLLKKKGIVFAKKSVKSSSDALPSSAEKERGSNKSATVALPADGSENYVGPASCNESSEGLLIPETIIRKANKKNSKAKGKTGTNLRKSEAIVVTSCRKFAKKKKSGSQCIAPVCCNSSTSAEMKFGKKDQDCNRSGNKYSDCNVVSGHENNVEHILGSGALDIEKCKTEKESDRTKRDDHVNSLLCSGRLDFNMDSFGNKHSDCVNEISVLGNMGARIDSEIYSIEKGDISQNICTCTVEIREGINDDQIIAADRNEFEAVSNSREKSTGVPQVKLHQTKDSNDQELTQLVCPQLDDCMGNHSLCPDHCFASIQPTNNEEVAIGNSSIDRSAEESHDNLVTVHIDRPTVVRMDDLKISFRTNLADRLCTLDMTTMPPYNSKMEITEKLILDGEQKIVENYESGVDVLIEDGEIFGDNEESNNFCIRSDIQDRLDPLQVIVAHPTQHSLALEDGEVLMESGGIIEDNGGLGVSMEDGEILKDNGYNDNFCIGSDIQESLDPPLELIDAHSIGQSVTLVSRDDNLHKVGNASCPSQSEIFVSGNHREGTHSITQEAPADVFSVVDPQHNKDVANELGVENASTGEECENKNLDDCKAVCHEKSTAGNALPVVARPKAQSTLKGSSHANLHARHRTWHRDMTCSAPVKYLHKSGSSSLSKISPKKHGKLLSSYIRKGNALIRKANGVPPAHQTLLRGISHNISKGLAGRSMTFVRGSHSSNNATTSNFSVERPRTPPLPVVSKPTSCRLDLLEGANQNLPERIVSVESEEILARKHCPKESEPVKQQILVGNEDQSICLKEPGTTGVVYVKRNSNQLIASHGLTSENSSNNSVNNLLTATACDLYYKKNKNQIIRNSGNSDGYRNNVSSDHESKCKDDTGSLISSGKTITGLLNRSLYKAHQKASKVGALSHLWMRSWPIAQKKGNPLKYLPFYLPWKRSVSWKKSVNCKPSLLSNRSSWLLRKLVLARNRDVIYSVSTNGFSLRKAGIRSIGGSSLKWSRSIERRSRKTNEEVTLAVAEVERKKRERRKNNKRRKTQLLCASDGKLKSDHTSSVQNGTFHCNKKYARARKGNSFVRDSKKVACLLASEKIRWSIHTARLRLAKKQICCQFFTRFGKCNKSDGTCPYMHDPAKVAVCTKFLRGLCSNVKCCLTHKVLPERMPDCSYFLRGLCTNLNCPYRHVNVNPNASVCEKFLRGYCSDGEECRKKHTYVCPVFESKGVCPEDSNCKLHHPKPRNKSEKRKFDAVLSNSTTGRYFSSSICDISEPLVSTDENDKPEHHSAAQLTDFISLTSYTDDELISSGDSSAHNLGSSLQDTRHESDSSIMPLRIMKKPKLDPRSLIGRWEIPSYMPASLFPHEDARQAHLFSDEKSQWSKPVDTVAVLETPIPASPL